MMMGERKMFDDDLIEQFLDRIFQEICGNSLIAMKELLENVAYSSDFSNFKLQKCDCNLNELDEMMEKLKDQRNKARNTVFDISCEKKKIKDEMGELNKKMSTLKKMFDSLSDKHTKLRQNSIVFSMDIDDD